MNFQKLAFLDLIKDASAGNKKIPQKDFLQEGKIPVVDQGQQLVAGYVNDRSSICNVKPPVIVFGDHTRAIKYIDFEFAMGADGIKVLVPKVESDTKYLYYALSYIKIPKAGYSRHYKFLKETHIPLPPLAEQKQIAAILDAADAMRVKRREAIALLNTLLQSTFLEMFGDPIFNPKGQPLIKLGDAVTFRGGGTPSKDNTAYWSDEIPWATVKDFKSLILYATQDSISKLGLKSSSASLIPAGHVIIPTRMSLGKAAINSIDLAINQDLKALLPKHSLHPRFLLHAVLCLSDVIKQNGKGATVKGITINKLATLEIPFPTPDLQHKFATIVESVEQQKTLHRAHLTELDTLFASLQQRAFNGELLK